jgi:hypothetical protein
MSTNYTFNDRDEFQRKQIAEKAVKILSSDIDISPMVIDGGWGTGKTEFCHKLISLMEEDDTHHLIYVDAFQADHADEPLLTILAEVIKLLPDDEAKQSFIQKVLPTARYGLKTLGKAAMAHLLRQDVTDVVDDFDKEIQKTTDKAIDASVEALLKDHIKADESLKSLQETLKDIADKKPIILFIDELDRCRPDFAVHMLEIIKHTFNVEGVKFVLITNTQQLKAAINHCYGSSIDSQRYLDKFLKLTINLPSFVNQEYSKQKISLAHYINLINKSTTLSDQDLTQKGTTTFLEHFFSVKKLTLREIETFVRHLEIAQALNYEFFHKNQVYGYKLFNLLGVLLHCFEPEISKSLSDEHFDATALIQSFNETSKSLNDIQGHLKPHQVILALVCSDSPQNRVIYYPKQESDIQMFERNIEGYFSRGWGRPDTGESYKIVANAINLINFTNN